MAKSGKPTDQIVIATRDDGQEIVTHNLVYGSSNGRTVFQGEVSLPCLVSGLANRLTGHAPLDLGLVPVGMTLRWLERNNGWYIFVVEETPGTHTVNWLRDDSPARYGSGATYRLVTLAFPWLYFFVVLSPSGELHRLNSVYFRHQPLTSLNDQLYDPHFFNCSVDAYGAHCWICTQYTGALDSHSLLARVDSFLHWFWNSGFNASSEHHEIHKGSFWTYNRDRIPDPRVQSVTAWEKASQRDPLFAMTVPWVAANHTPLTVCQELTATTSLQLGLPCTVRGLANLIRHLSQEEDNQ